MKKNKRNSRVETVEELTLEKNRRAMYRLVHIFMVWSAIIVLRAVGDIIIVGRIPAKGTKYSIIIFLVFGLALSSSVFNYKIALRKFRNEKEYLKQKQESSKRINDI